MPKLKIPKDVLCIGFLTNMYPKTVENVIRLGYEFLTPDHNGRANPVMCVLFFRSNGA